LLCPYEQLRHSHQKQLLKDYKKFGKELTKQTQTQNVSQCVKEQPFFQKPGVTSMDNQWMPQEIRGKLMKSSGLKYFITFSAFFHDKSLNDPFFSDICAKCNIFKSN